MTKSNAKPVQEILNAFDKAKLKGHKFTNGFVKDFLEDISLTEFRNRIINECIMQLGGRYGAAATKDLQSLKTPENKPAHTCYFDGTNSCVYCGGDMYD